MQMSDSEIVRSYKEAKDKRSQVGVLAELNACSKDCIRKILQRNGINAPKPGRKSTTESEPVKDEEPKKAYLTEMARRALKIEEPEIVKEKSEIVKEKSKDRALKNEPTEDDTPDELLLLATERLKNLRESRAEREHDIQIMQSIVDDYLRREEKLQAWIEKHKKEGE